MLQGSNKEAIDVMRMGITLALGSLLASSSAMIACESSDGVGGGDAAGDSDGDGDGDFDGNGDGDSDWPVDGIEYWEMQGEAEAVDCSCHWAEWGYTSEDECRALLRSSGTVLSCWEDTYGLYLTNVEATGFFSCLATLYANLIDCHDNSSCDEAAIDSCFEEFDNTEEDCSVISSTLYDEVISVFEVCIGD